MLPRAEPAARYSETLRGPQGWKRAVVNKHPPVVYGELCSHRCTKIDLLALAPRFLVCQAAMYCNDSMVIPCNTHDCTKVFLYIHCQGPCWSVFLKRSKTNTVQIAIRSNYVPTRVSKKHAIKQTNQPSPNQKQTT